MVLYALFTVAHRLTPLKKPSKPEINLVGFESLSIYGDFMTRLDESPRISCIWQDLLIPRASHQRASSKPGDQAWKYVNQCCELHGFLLSGNRRYTLWWAVASNILRQSYGLIRAIRASRTHDVELGMHESVGDSYFWNSDRKRGKY